MSNSPINIQRALDSFEQLWSPRIAARVNDYDVRISKVQGVHVWHRHEHTDEFFMVLSGTLDIGLREVADDAVAERMVHLGVGDVFVVPCGVEHRPQSDDGASLLLFEPSGTLSTGDTAEAVPDHVDSTIGHDLVLG